LNIEHQKLFRFETQTLNIATGKLRMV